MAINQTPPPPQPAPVPAQIQTVNAAHAQRLASPGQTVVNSVNSGNYGKGFTASMPNSAQPTAAQRTQNAMNALKDAGSVAQGIGNARNQRNINRDNNSPSRKGPGYTQKPPDKSSGNNKAIANMKAKSASGQQSTPKSASQACQNKGIAAARQKSSASQQGASKPSNSMNKGISSFQSKSGGQASSASKGSSVGTSKGSSTGASKGGQSR